MVKLIKRVAISNPVHAPGGRVWVRSVLTHTLRKTVLISIRRLVSDVAENILINIPGRKIIDNASSSIEVSLSERSNELVIDALKHEISRYPANALTIVLITFQTSSFLIEPSISKFKKGA